MRVAAFAAVVAVTLATPAYADMSVSTFMGKADALKAKGVLAMMSSDVSLLQTEMKAAFAAYRSDVDAAVAAKRPPPSCPPPKGSAKISSDEVVADFRTIPAAQQAKISVKTAVYAMMKKRYPCR